MPVKPSEAEEAYFARQEFERRKALEVELHARMKVEEKKRLKETHYMHCPKCGMELIEIDLKGVKVDKCSECDGLWLDANELEAILEKEKGKLDLFLAILSRKS